MPLESPAELSALGPLEPEPELSEPASEALAPDPLGADPLVPEALGPGPLDLAGEWPARCSPARASSDPGPDELPCRPGRSCAAGADRAREWSTGAVPGPVADRPAERAVAGETTASVATGDRSSRRSSFGAPATPIPRAAAPIASFATSPAAAAPPPAAIASAAGPSNPGMERASWSRNDVGSGSTAAAGARFTSCRTRVRARTSSASTAGGVTLSAAATSS